MMHDNLKRKKMIEGQLKPHHPQADALLWAFSQVEREKCVALSHQNLAYTDGFIPQNHERYLMPAFTLSQTLEALKIQENDSVLIIGAGLGYSAMITCYMAQTITALEWDEDLMNKGHSLITEKNFDSIHYKHISSMNELKNYENTVDVILIEGAMNHIPAIMTNCLKEKGRLVAYVVNGLGSHSFPMTTAILVERYSHGIVEKNLFKTDMPLLTLQEKILHD